MPVRQMTTARVTLPGEQAEGDVRVSGVCVLWCVMHLAGRITHAGII